MESQPTYQEPVIAELTPSEGNDGASRWDGQGDAICPMTDGEFSPVPMPAETSQSDPVPLTSEQEVLVLWWKDGGEISDIARGLRKTQRWIRHELAQLMEFGLIAPRGNGRVELPQEGPAANAGLTLKQAAAELGMGYEQLRRLVSSGKIVFRSAVKRDRPGLCWQVSSDELPEIHEQLSRLPKRW